MTKQTTPNYDWVIGDSNKQNPAAPDIKQTFTDIDAKVYSIETGVLGEPQRSILLVGLLSARPPAATALDGVRFKATDVRATYYCDGTQWIDDGGSTVTVNGVEPDPVTGDIPLTPEDLGFDLSVVTPGDIGAMPYPSSGSDGDVATKSGTGVAWAAPSGGSSTIANALFGGIGIWGESRVVPKPVTAYGTTIVDFSIPGHGWTVTGPTGAAQLDDTTTYRLKPQSLAITAGIHATTLTYATSPTLGSTIDLTTSVMEILFQLGSGTATDTNGGIAGYTVEISSNGGTNWAATDGFYSHNLIERSPKWDLRRYNKDSFAVQGTVNYAAINKIRIGARTSTSATLPANFWAQKIRLYAATEPKASITFGVEGYASGYPMYDEFLKRDIRPTVYVRPNNASSMTAAQLAELQHSYGFGIGAMQWSDTEVNTANMISTDPTAFEAGLLKSLNWFKVNGLERPRLWNVPGAASGSGTLSEILTFGRRYFEASISKITNANNQMVNVMPANNPHACTGLLLFNVSSVLSTQYQQYIDRIVETKSHGFINAVNMAEAASGSTGIARVGIAAVLDYIISKGSAIEVLTGNEWCRQRQQVT